MLKKGQICFSKAGHDKGGAFIVLHSDDTYAYIADGKLRTLEKPKKKKKIHIQISNEVNSEIENMLEQKVNLKLWVKVKKDWRDSDFLIKNFGYREEE